MGRKQEFTKIPFAPLGVSYGKETGIPQNPICPVRGKVWVETWTHPKYQLPRQGQCMGRKQEFTKIPFAPSEVYANSTEKMKKVAV